MFLNLQIMLYSLYKAQFTSFIELFLYYSIFSKKSKTIIKMLKKKRR